MTRLQSLYMAFIFPIVIFTIAGTAVVKGEIIPVRLLEPPAFSISPGVFQVFPEKILFSWPEVKKASLYHVEISSGKSYRTLIVEAEISDNKLLVDYLPEEIYFWHVSCINSQGLEGRFSQTFIFYNIR